MTTHHLRRLLAVLAMLAVLAGACGSDDPDTATPAAGTATTDSSGDTDAGADDGHDAGGEDGATEVAEPAVRLLVADSESGEVVVLDLATGEEIERLTLTGPARLYTEPHGRYVLAAQRDDDLVDWLDGGAWTSPHGDHDHHWAAAPKIMTDWRVDGPQPTHVVFHHDSVTVFNDGDGSVWALDTHHLGEPDAAIGSWESGAAHHGVALALEEQGVAVLTIPSDDPEDSLPIGVVVVDLDTGAEVDRFENCPGLHGEFATDEVVAFGCTDGVLLVEPHGDHWHGEKVARPDGIAEEVRTGTLTGGHDLDYMIGNLGPDALVRIDLGAQTATALPLPGTAAAWAFDAESEHVLVLTVDGSFHRLDPTSGDALESIELTDPIELPQGHGGPPRPAILASHGRSYVSDPANRQIIEVATNDELRDARRFDVGLAPLSMAIAGLAAH